MYAHIEGVLSDKFPGGVAIDCGGVGYALTVSGATLSASPRTGEPWKLYAYLSVREDALELFGFATREEKRMFEKLIGVGGVGPKLALAALSALSVGALALALASGDAESLARVPGIGKKTAQRLILELRDKVEDAELEGVRAVSAGAGGAGSEAVEALMALGYNASDAARAVAAVSSKSDRADELVFFALKGMDR